MLMMMIIIVSLLFWPSSLKCINVIAGINFKPFKFQEEILDRTYFHGSNILDDIIFMKQECVFKIFFNHNTGREVATEFLTFSRLRQLYTCNVI